MLLVGLVVLAETLGLELILGAFLAGVVAAAVDRDEGMTHPLFRPKLEAMGFGLFIPVFFVASGVAIDVTGILARPADLVLVPLFLGALLVVRGLPAVLYRSAIGARPAVAAGLLQATSLPFIVAATQIGLELGALDASRRRRPHRRGPAVRPRLPGHRAGDAGRPGWPGRRVQGERANDPMLVEAM